LSSLRVPNLWKASVKNLAPKERSCSVLCGNLRPLKCPGKFFSDISSICAGVSLLNGGSRSPGCPSRRRFGRSSRVSFGGRYSAPSR